MTNRIMIDPGHAPGNVNKGPTGYYEYAGMWRLSNFLKAVLERCGFEVALTRTESECPELTTRGLKAEGCVLFISEHSNADGSGYARGCEVYHSVRIPDDAVFAQELSERVSDVFNSASRGAKTKLSTLDPEYDYYTVIGYAVSTGCPHVLLCENAFHTNATEEGILKTDAGLRAIAEAQARVICARLGTAYVSETPAAPAPTPTPEPTPMPSESSGLSVGDTVRIRDGVTTFADGVGMASSARNSLLYVRQLGDGKTLISTLASGAVTGWVRTADLVREDGGTVVVPTPAPAPAPAPAPVPTPSAPPASSPAPAPVASALTVGDTVRIRDGVTTFADGTGMMSFVRTSVLYVRQIGSGKLLISTVSSGAVTGWVRTDDVVRA